MNFGKWFAVVLVWLGFGLAAHAQLGVYGLFAGTTLTNIKCLDPNGVCSSANGKVSPLATFGGVYYDFYKLGPVKLGVDFRAGDLHSNKSAVYYGGGTGATTAQSFLGGVRGLVPTPWSWLKPYGQISAGWARSNAALAPTGTSSLTPQVYDHYFEYEAFAGADVRLFSVLDLRAIEVGIGNMNQMGASNGASTTSMGVRSIGAGLVFHLPQH